LDGVGGTMDDDDVSVWDDDASEIGSTILTSLSSITTPLDASP
jgi:hypothetical protein